MSNKALVEVYIPASGERFDVWIPLESKMSEVKLMISKALGEISGGMYQANDETVLCDADTGCVFDINTEVAELGIENGSRLLLI